MARIRTIKPEYFTSLTTADLSLLAFALFPGLLTHVDDEGRCVDEPRLIKAALAPLRDGVTAKDIDAVVDEYVEADMVVRYSVEGRDYLEVTGFDEHQRVNRPTPSKYPSPDDADPPTEQSETTHPQLIEPSLPEGNREQGREQGETLDGSADAEHVEDDHPDFDTWWDAYRDVARGRPTGYGNRKPAERAWKALNRTQQAEALEAVPIYARLLSLEDADRTRPYPAQHGSTWLNQRTFEDVAQQLADRQAPTATARGQPTATVDKSRYCDCGQRLDQHDDRICEKGAA